MYAYEIYWDVDMEEVYELFDVTMTPMEASKILKINPMLYLEMNADQRHGCIYSKVHHCPALLDQLLGLPERVLIPEVLAKRYRKTSDASDITEYLSDVFGYCINGYSICEKEENKWAL